MRKISSHPGAVFEDPGFADPEIHDPAIIHQVVRDAEDETRMRLTSFIRRCRPFQFSVRRVYEIMPLRLAGDAIALVQTGVEPLGGIGNACLVEDTVYEFFIKDLSVFGSSEIAIPFPPYLPAIGHTMGYLSDRGLSSQRTVRLGNAGFAEIFLGQYICSNLTPPRRHFHIVHLEHHFPAGVADHGGPEVVCELIEDAGTGPGETARK